MFDKLKILTDAAKYDVACTSSGVERKASAGGIGSSRACGICHSFSADGRCISLLKVLMTNSCQYDCKYCINRRSNSIARATFAPRELADLTMSFYRRNYIEGLFLSSGVLKNPDYTCERIMEVLRILRREYGFQGYIHAKAIPGASSILLHKIGLLADRMSVNIELPSQSSLKLLAPDKSRHSILTPMGYIKDRIGENSRDIARYPHAPKFVPAGQSTQMIVGATSHTDFHILRLSESLYKKYKLKRVFFSAYVALSGSSLLPKVNEKPPLLREHRLYQADWLMRYYGFSANEILDQENQNFNAYIDPKCNWAVHHMEYFPVEINRASYNELLRVPGIGVRSARRIVSARGSSNLDFQCLKKMGVVVKRAQYFVICNGKSVYGLKMDRESVIRSLMSESSIGRYRRKFEMDSGYQQLCFF